ncbi:MAG: hypothetical protein ABIH99_05090 [Candidatus Micrarchaeota archaeon]
MREEDIAAINSEIRFLTIDLMKIAAQRRQSFNSILNEFINNVYVVSRAIRKRSVKRSKRLAKKQMRTLTTSKR